MDEFLAGGDLLSPQLPKESEVTLSYYPVIFNNESVTLKVKKALGRAEIASRRYFYPSLSTLEYVRGNNTPIAEDIARRHYML